MAPLAPHSGGPNPNPQPPTDCRGRRSRPRGTRPHSIPRALPQPPSFNESDTTDKPASIQSRAPLSAEDVATITRNYRCRLESLLAVDDAVGQIIAALEATGELDNTIVVFTADNGFFHGEHRIRSGKVLVYEESIRVPLMISGPGIPVGQESEELVVNADLAPTIVDAASATAGRVMDGRSLLPIAEDTDRQLGREILLESGRPSKYVAIRTHRYLYSEYDTGEFELYDLERDPFQLSSLHADPGYAEVVTRLSSRLDALRGCAGEQCLATPKLSLELERGPRPEGTRHPCVGHPIKALLDGPAADLIKLATFEVAGEPARTDRKAPFGGRLKRTLFRLRGKTSIDATVELIDGRQMTLERRIRACP